jgi:hypothetical protein
VVTRRAGCTHCGVVRERDVGEGGRTRSARSIEEGIAHPALHSSHPSPFRIAEVHSTPSTLGQASADREGVRDRGRGRGRRRGRGEGEGRMDGTRRRKAGRKSQKEYNVAWTRKGALARDARPLCGEREAGEEEGQWGGVGVGTGGSQPCASRAGALFLAAGL